MLNADLEKLANVMLDFAKQMLATHKEFYPFGFTVTSSGEIEMQGAIDGAEQPQSEELIDLLTRSAQIAATTGEIRAAGICFDVRTTPPGQTDKTDAICMSLEDRTGQSVTMYVPYKKGWLGKHKYSDAFAGPKAAQIFVQA